MLITVKKVFTLERKDVVNKNIVVITAWTIPKKTSLLSKGADISFYDLRMLFTSFQNGDNFTMETKVSLLTSLSLRCRNSIAVNQLF